MSNVTISKESIHRLLTDVRDIMKNPLHSNGVYYTHDDTDMLRGWAMIVGPEDTPYFGGFYFFKFQFPTDYPYSPPIVTCHTNDGRVRFNPNLYTSGKVCISILNTWRGEQWSGCQNIRSVLMTFQSLLDKEPLLHEPGIRKEHSDFIPYHLMVEYYNYKFACLTLMKELTTHVSIEPALVPDFKQFMDVTFRENKDRIREILAERLKQHPDRKSICVGLYGGIHTVIAYDNVILEYKSVVDALNA